MLYMSLNFQEAGRSRGCEGSPEDPQFDNDGPAFCRLLSLKVSKLFMLLHRPPNPPRVPLAFYSAIGLPSSTQQFLLCVCNGGVCRRLTSGIAKQRSWTVPNLMYASFYLKTNRGRHHGYSRCDLYCLRHLHLQGQHQKQLPHLVSPFSSIDELGKQLQVVQTRDTSHICWEVEILERAVFQ